MQALSQALQQWADSYRHLEERVRNATTREREVRGVGGRSAAAKVYALFTQYVAQLMPSPSAKGRGMCMTY